MNYEFATRMTDLTPSAVREIMKNAVEQDDILFASGNPATESFPLAAIREITEDILNNDAFEVLKYGISEGYQPLRDRLALRMKEKYACMNDSDEVLITSGAQQVIDMACRVLLNEGDTVICDSPCYMGALNVFRSYNVHIKGVEMEKDGLNLDKLEQLLKTEKNVKLLYVVPNFQNPTGITMSMEKRKAVYALCKKYGVLILEDDPYGELRYSGGAIAPIKSMDTDGIVIYSGSFSKVLSAGIRVGFSYAPKPISDKIILAKQVSDVHTNTFFQVMADRFMERYDLDKHIAFIREIYRKKSALMIGAMQQHLSDCDFLIPEGGLFVWCTLPKSIDMIDFCIRAADNKVMVVPGTAFTISEEYPCNAFRLNYSTPSDEQIVRGVELLGKTLKSYC